MDNVEYTNAVEGILSNPIGKDCHEIAVEEFSLASPTAASFLKFTALDFHPGATSGSGIQFLGWE